MWVQAWSGPHTQRVWQTEAVCACSSLQCGGDSSPPTVSPADGHIALPTSVALYGAHRGSWG